VLPGRANPSPEVNATGCTGKRARRVRGEPLQPFGQEEADGPSGMGTSAEAVVRAWANVDAPAEVAGPELERGLLDLETGETTLTSHLVRKV